MVYKNKTYVAFDGDNDIKYYNLMKAWKQNNKSDFNFFDAHDLNNALDSSTEETIKRKLAERMSNSKVFLILVGEHTKNLRKFVLWEIKQAVQRDLPIIVVNLNKKRKCDNLLCPKILKNSLSIHIPYNEKIVQYALENWPSSHATHRSNNEDFTYHYKDSVYKGLDL